MGSNVLGFHVGDKVSCYHKAMTPHGAYAEYAIAPINSSFHIPPKISFEEAVTFGVPAFTAAIGLNQDLRLPAPWEGRREEFKDTPLIVYGAASAVGAFVIKFAKLAGIGPIIAVAGKSRELVQSLLGPEDRIVDYRSPDVVGEIRAALEGRECRYAYDAISDHGSLAHLVAVLSAPAKIAYTVFLDPKVTIPEGIKALETQVWTAHRGNEDSAAMLSLIHI